MKTSELQALASANRVYDPDITLKEAFLDCYKILDVDDWSDDWDTFREEEEYEEEYRIRVSAGTSVVLKKGVLVKLQSTSYIDVNYKIK